MRSPKGQNTFSPKIRRQWAATPRFLREYISETFKPMRKPQYIPMIYKSQRLEGRKVVAQHWPKTPSPKQVKLPKPLDEYTQRFEVPQLELAAKTGASAEASRYQPITNTPRVSQRKVSIKIPERKASFARKPRKKDLLLPRRSGTFILNDHSTRKPRRTQTLAPHMLHLETKA